ncbi:unnamed protein product [Peronospora belbahrii]|uniref:Thioredoxin domain-containing protein n=1 Tax=Peronospora belbahrii TaxID=622444 RepID=A0AAU9LPT2_9STRA|nr:unnamed protein product [Peronospora belbahrii]CAH0521889.1 unnamed protein product [Peronospora belbahrii]
MLYIYTVLLAVLCLYSLSWTYSSALKTITTSLELDAIKASNTVHLLLVFAKKDEMKEKSLDELVLTAYPLLLDIEKDLDGFVTFNVMDIASDPKGLIRNQWQFKKLPGLVLYKDLPKKNPYTGKLYRDAIVLDVTMLENPRKLKRTLNQAIPMEFVQELEGEALVLSNFETLVQQKRENEETVVLLISTEKHATPMYRALAAEFSDQGLSFVFVNQDKEGAKEIMEKLDVEELSAVVVVKSMTDRVVLKEENSKLYIDLKGFVEPFAKQKSKEGKAGVKRNKEGKKASKYIKFLTEKDFNDLVMQSDVVWIIEFMDLERELAVVEEDWKKALMELHRKTGVVAMGAVSCEKEAELCERYGGPGIRIFPLGVTDANTLKRESVLAKTFTSFDEAKMAAIETIPDLTVTIASSSDLNSFISHARNNHALPTLFFTTKNITPPSIKALLLSAPTHKVMLAVIRDADEDMKRQFLVKSSASTALVCLVPTQDSSENATSQEFGLVVYNKNTMGPYNVPNMMRFMLQVLAQYPHPQDVKSESDEVNFSSLDEVSAQALVPYMTKQNIAAICGGNKICAIGFFEDHVDTLKDPDSRLTKWWTTLVHVAAQSKQNKEPFDFVWVNGKCQKDFAEAFGVGHFQMPTVAVYSPSKQRFATNVGVYDVQSASAFLKSVLSGSISTAPIGNVPELVEECSFDEIYDVAVGTDDGVENNEDLDDMLSEILSDEKQQRDELEKELKSELKKDKKKGKTKGKKKKNKAKKKKAKKKKAARDEL